ncbi:copper chaperone PCu(A)C [Propionivibrio sp.]|uniref:copper chaperone PCu(A)C n=1 Tax=Propionivibrio sp. TaxID=2212460 RepID=UPI003BF137CB
MTIRFCRFALLLVAAATLPMSTLSLAAEADLSVNDAYVREVPPGTKTTLAFMTIKNVGTADRKLVKADSPVAKTVELHSHTNDNGVMKMRQVKEIDIKAKGQAELKSGSYHIMLIDLKQALKEGDIVPVTLTFDDGSTKKIDAPVKKPQAMMQMDNSMDHSKMKH